MKNDFFNPYVMSIIKDFKKYFDAVIYRKKSVMNFVRLVTIFSPVDTFFLNKENVARIITLSMF